MISEKVGWHGRIKVTITYRDGSVDVEEFDNLITNAGKNLLRDALQVFTDCEIKYMAWGSGTTAPAATQTQLVSEAGRKAVTRQTAGGTGVGVTTVYLAPFDANVQIQELGWFAGATATSAANSGVMIARVLFSRLKNNLESIQVDRTDTIT
ncbi:hypothetical protein [Paenibacillus sp. HJGM_3]|uniref:hypothetical protein n=1 Tax=Paenibacillus sp. HJGM_3 TaxID=3379816 RepID=UPI00385F5D79